MSNDLSLALEQYGKILDTVLKIDLTTEHFDVIKATKGSLFYNCHKSKNEKISQWYLNNLFLPGMDLIHPNDAEGFLCFINVYNTYTNMERSVYFYRIMNIKREYVWRRLEVVPAEDNNVYVYITNAFIASLKAAQEEYIDFSEEVRRMFENTSEWEGSIGVIAFEPENPNEDLNLAVKDYFAPIYTKENCYIQDGKVYIITKAQTRLEFCRLLLIVHRKLKSEDKRYRITHYWTDDDGYNGDEFLEQFRNKM